MVRTLSNAFETGRIPQAWMLTGVRGVGKTTTARILARGLNYQKADGGGRPTIHMPELGVHCEAIMESRHVDVLEMDAASHTGIDDVRQIIDGIRYSPGVGPLQGLHHRRGPHALGEGVQRLPEDAGGAAAAREVHLRHHRDPQGPGHRSCPAASASTCAASRRTSSSGISAASAMPKGVQADQEALAAIARAAEGSARDLSRSWTRPSPTAPGRSPGRHRARHAGARRPRPGHRPVRGRDARRRAGGLRSAARRNTMPAPIPAVILSDLAAFSHIVTRLKLIPEAAKDPALSEIERTRGTDYAGKLSVRTLSRAWQILLKGIPEVQASNRPSRRPKWCSCASPMRPICRRRTRPCAR